MPHPNDVRAWAEEVLGHPGIPNSDDPALCAWTTAEYLRRHPDPYSTSLWNAMTHERQLEIVRKASAEVLVQALLADNARALAARHSPGELARREEQVQGELPLRAMFVCGREDS